MIDALKRAADNRELLEVGRKAVEDALVMCRDQRLSCGGFRGNGLVIKEKDGSPSDVIRFGTEVALHIAMKAMAAKLEGDDDAVATTA